jgi:hypothetical protein
MASGSCRSCRLLGTLRCKADGLSLAPSWGRSFDNSQIQNMPLCAEPLTGWWVVPTCRYPPIGTHPAPAPAAPPRWGRLFAAERLDRNDVVRALCPRCNAGDDDPRMPKGFKTEFDKKGWRH